MSLQRALFILIAIALLAGFIPAAVVLERRLASALEDRARRDLAVATEVLRDRESMTAEALMMHAKDLAGADGLAEALQRKDRPAAVAIIEAARSSLGERAVLVGGEGEVWTGAGPGSRLIEATRSGEMPVALVADRGGLQRVALAPVTRAGSWVGAAGVSVAFDQAAAGALAGITQSEVIVLLDGRSVVASTAGDEVTESIAGWAGSWDGGGVRELQTGGGRSYLVAASDLEGIATVVFARDLESELAVLPQLRRVAALAGLSALVLALVLGAILAAMLARPVAALAGAADRLAGGDFSAPLRRSAVQEIDRMAQAFDEMRSALSARLEEVEEANEQLAERQRKLTALQAELIQRDRLAAAGRLVTELAHEIRNPVANVRNCLEVIGRRVSDDRQAREFTDLAIDELLRMHELAERMLDLNRPRDPDALYCDAVAVAEEVTALVRAGVADQALEVELCADARAEVEIPPDALKQVLLNLVQNAREAVADRGRIEIRVDSRPPAVNLEVRDDGPGIDPEILPRIFDPFFTTKGAVQGVGLGLFVAEGIVRSHGGRITAANRADGEGASFGIELPARGDAQIAETPGSSEAAAGAELPEDGGSKR